MKIECLKEKIATPLSLAEKITGKNTTLPILKCLLLEAKNNNLVIRSTNLDMGIEISLPVKVDEAGLVAVPGNVLNSFVSSLSGEKNIVFETVDGNLKVSTKSNTTLIKAYPSEDFPGIPEVEGKKIVFSTKDLITGFKSVWYSSSVSSMKPELSSVFVYPDGETIVFVATDSFRLAEKRVKNKHKKDFSQILIPFKNVPEIIRVLEEGEDEEVEVAFNKNQIVFNIGGIRLVSRVVDGIFPDYKQIIPKSGTTEAVILKQDFINSLKLANIFSDTFNQVSFKVSPKAKTFEITTRNGEVGENHNKLQASLTGEGVDISFNYKYINDCFQSINTDSISLSFNGGNRPVVIKGVNDSSFLYLISPMNK